MYAQACDCGRAACPRGDPAETKKALSEFAKCLKSFCAQRQNRTADTRIFNPLLYRLSYLGMWVGNPAADNTF